MQPLRILFFDLETTPNVTYQWRPNQDYTPHTMLIREHHLLSWAAKWRGRNYVYSDVLTPAEVKRADDSRIMGTLYDVMVDADIVVAHNINRFDWPRFRGYILDNELPPLPEPRIIDTVNWAKQFGLPYKKLDYLSERFGFGGKHDTDMDLWRRCMEGDTRALKYMAKYNRKDVRDLEGIFEKFLPYVKGVPKLVVATEPNEFVCPFCGSPDLQKRGFKDTNAARYQRYQCKNCLKYPSHPVGQKVSKLALRPT